MSQALRIFIREAINEANYRSAMIETSLGDRGEQLDIKDYKKSVTPRHGGSSNSSKSDADDRTALDSVVTFFSDGFTDAQKLGIGEGSIIGSKVSISKMGPPKFVVLCKINYKGKDYMIAIKYSEAKDFNPIGTYGDYLDPDVLLQGDITALPDPQKVYKIKEEEVSVMPLGSPGSATSMGSPPVGQKRIPFFGMGGKQTIDLNRYGLDPGVQAAEHRDYLKRKAIKALNTALQSKQYVESSIIPINKKSPGEISEIFQKDKHPAKPLVNIFKLIPVSYADFEDESPTRSIGWKSEFTPVDLYNEMKLFAFDPKSKVFPPPFSYTVEGSIKTLEAECAFDAKQYINTFWKNTMGDLTEREELNLSICSNEIASSIVIDLVTLAAVGLGAVTGTPIVSLIALSASASMQGLALVQLLTYQVSKGYTESAILTAGRILFLCVPFLKLSLAIEMIVTMIQVVTDITGGTSVKSEVVKQYFLNKISDVSDKDNVKLSEIPEIVNFTDAEALALKIPLALEEKRIIKLRRNLA